jgi:hypothetical protein
VCGVGAQRLDQFGIEPAILLAQWLITFQHKKIEVIAARLAE